MGKINRKKELEQKNYHVNLILLFIGIISIILLLYQIGFFDSLIGYKLRIDFYQKPRIINGNESIIVDLVNEGAFDLHNLKAKLSYHCYDATKAGHDYSLGEAFFDEPSYHLLKNDKPRQIFFRDKQLIDVMDNEHNKNCSDAIFSIIAFDTNNESELKFDYLMIFRYYKETDSIISEKFESMEDFKEEYFCVTCNAKLDINTDEKNFTKEINLTVSSAMKPLLDYPGISMPGVSKYYYSKIFASRYDFCDIPNTNCQGHVIDKIDKLYPEFDIKQ